MKFFLLILFQTSTIMGGQWFVPNGFVGSVYETHEDCQDKLKFVQTLFENEVKPSNPNAPDLKLSVSCTPMDLDE